MMAQIELATPNDVSRHAESYARDGHVHIPNFLREDDARYLFEALAHRTPWRLMLIDDGPVEFTQEQWAAMPPKQKLQINANILTAGKVRFEGRFCSFRFSDAGETFLGDIPELVALSRFLNGDAFLSYVRKITGALEIEFADAQATLYRPGDFLHAHDDIYLGKKRVAAYVLNLTPQWNAEWGGLLGFLDNRGHVARAYKPVWNGLNLLKVPQRHYVSTVTPFGSDGRYCVTGWLRNR